MADAECKSNMCIFPGGSSLDGKCGCYDGGCGEGWCDDGECRPYASYGGRCDDNNRCDSSKYVCESPVPGSSFAPQCLRKTSTKSGETCFADLECDSQRCIQAVPGEKGTCGCSGDAVCGDRFCNAKKECRTYTAACRTCDKTGSDGNRCEPNTKCQDPHGGNRYVCDNDKCK